MSQSAISSLIWSVADLLRGDYKPADYGRVILPFTVLRRLDWVLASTKAAVLAEKVKREAMGVNPDPFLLRVAKPPTRRPASTSPRVTPDCASAFAAVEDLLPDSFPSHARKTPRSSFGRTHRRVRQHRRCRNSTDERRSARCASSPQGDI